MTRPDDKILMDYADGVLSDGERAAVAAYLLGDAEARELVEKYRTSLSLLDEAFAEPMRTAPPRTLVDTVLNAGTVAVATAEPPAQRIGSGAGTTSSRFILPLAASILLLAGAAGWFMLGPSAELPAGGFGIAIGPVNPSSPLGRTLDTAPAGVPTDTTGPGAGPARLEVVITFRDRRARPCREFELLTTAKERQPVAAGIACRSDGRWVIEGAVRLAESPASDRPDYVPSGLTEKDALDGILSALGAQPALSAADEKTLINRRWD